MQQKNIADQQALSRLATECARAEHCSGEILEKMHRWGLSEETQAHIMAYLTDHKYIDDERFTHSFVSDKIKYNKWGRRKMLLDLALAKSKSRVTLRPQVFFLFL